MEIFKIDKTDLEYIDLSVQYLINADLEGANLMDANLYSAKLSEHISRELKLPYSKVDSKHVTITNHTDPPYYARKTA